MDTVAALGVAVDLLGVFGAPHPPVVHAVPVAVLEHGHVGRVLSFPGPFEIDSHLGRARPVQGQAQIVHARDQPVVDEELQTRPDIPDVVVRPGRQ